MDREGLTSVVQPQKPPSDKREYRGFVLPNKLQVLLVSDPETDKSAAAIDVGVGHFQDPEEVPGLAHFCEHMLFLGTEKYPDENSYSAFLASHGGSSNAYTSMENTNYYFDVANEHFEEGLDRLAQFFIAPLFTEEATEREMKAVDSENAKNLQNDDWRLLQLLKCSANPEHPYHKFGSGNLITLKERPTAQGIDVRKALMAFHKKYYSANVIKLAVLGKESLDTLQSWVVSRFSNVVNTDRKHFLNDLSILPFRQSEELGSVYSIVPVKDVRVLIIIFPLPALFEHYLKKPSHYISHLIGHESEGSLLSYLKKKGWANELSAGSSRTASDFELFKINIKLTEQGLEHVYDIVGHLFEYIEMLRQAKTPDWIFNEIKLIDSIDFRFKEKETPINYVSSLAQNMRWYPAEHVIAAAWLTEIFDPPLIEDILSRLNPRNMRIHVIAKSFQGIATQTEEWYKTQFLREHIDNEQLNKWSHPTLNEALHLPPVNEFIPTELELKPKPETSGDFPTLIRSDSHIDVWFKQDDQFLLPKADVRVAFVTPLSHDSPKHMVATHLYMLLLIDALNMYSYLAEIGGLKFTVTISTRGLYLHLHGYSQKLDVLLIKVLNCMKTLEVTSERFDVYKDRVARDYRNFYMNPPWEHARYELEQRQLNQTWEVEEKIEAIDNMRREDVEAIIPRILEELFVETLVVGNFTKEEALGIAAVIPSVLQYQPLSVNRRPERRIVQLEDKHTYIVQKNEPNPNNHNSAIYYYYQIGLDPIHVEAPLNLLGQISNEPAFDQLRTKEQLGYLVWSGVRTYYGILGFRFIVQSAVKDPVHIQGRIEAFVVTLRDMLATMTDERFADYKEAVITRLQEKDKTILQLAARFWEELSSHQFVFDRRERLIKELRENVTKEGLLQFFDERIAHGGKKRSVLSIQVFGNQHPISEVASDQEGSKSGINEGEKVIVLKGTASKFRRSMHLFPDNS